jgi:hypothetical protein
VEYQKSVCYVKGNFLDIVPSKPNFRFSLSQFSTAVKMFKKPHQHIYNLSNGAYLDETVPLSIDDINPDTLQTLEKKTLQQEINLFLKTNSSCEFTELDRVYLQSQIDIAKSIIEKCDELRKTKPKEVNNYLFRKLIPLMQEISEMHKREKSDIGEIFFEYFKITLSFIFDTFNTKNLKDTKKHIQNMDKIVLDEVKKVATTYYETLNNYQRRV